MSENRKSYDLPQVANLFKQLSEDPAALQAALSSSNRTTPVANSEESNGRRISAPLAPISQPSNLGRSLIASRSVFGEPIHAPSTSRNSYAFSAKKRSNNTKGQYPDFSKKVILLEKWRNKPLTVTEEKELRKSGCVCDSMTFQKKMNESEILKKIETYFNDKKGKLVKSDNLQILQSLGNELFEYEIEEDQLTGELLSKNNKPMYVRVRSPKEEDIITKNSDSEEDVFQTKRPRPSTSCNKKADNPKESPKESESTPGVYFFTDEFGTEHRLVDHIPVKYDSTDHSNSTVCPQEIKSVIDMCQVKVSKTQTILVPVNRQNVTEMFLSVLSKNPDLPFRTLTVDFSNENGVGVGPRKELFSLLLLNIRESKLLEGNEFCKTPVHSVIALRSGEYTQLGVILALSIAHGGPFPRFFTETSFRLLFNLDIDINKLGPDDVQNANVRGEIKSVLDANTCAGVNSALADSTIFAAAGTYNQVAEKNWQDQKMIAVKDAIEYYVVTRVREPARKISEGLNKYYGLLDLLKNCNMEKVKNLFCYDEGEVLTAETIIAELYASKVVKKSETYAYWIRFLKDLERKDSDYNLELKDVLYFATSEYAIPPLGFSESRRPNISVMPYLMPKSNTCFNELILPSLNPNYEEFKLMMKLAIKYGDGFGNV